MGKEAANVLLVDEESLRQQLEVTTQVQASPDASPLIALADLFDNDDWKSLGSCSGLDPDLFFPERGASTREAKEVCRGCIVKEICLEYALSNGEKFGIWGGLSERERRRVRRQRAIARRTGSIATQ